MTPEEILKFSLQPQSSGWNPIGSLTAASYLTAWDQPRAAPLGFCVPPNGDHSFGDYEDNTNSYQISHDASVAVQANILPWVPVRLDQYGRLITVKIKLNAGSAVNAKVHIYGVSETGAPGRRLGSSSAVSCATSGIKTFEVVGEFFPAWVWVAVTYSATGPDPFVYFPRPLRVLDSDLVLTKNLPYSTCAFAETPPNNPTILLGTAETIGLPTNVALMVS
jgi:hypothetical protein